MKKNRIECKHCGAMFARADNLERHEQSGACTKRQVQLVLGGQHPSASPQPLQLRPTGAPQLSAGGSIVAPQMWSDGLSAAAAERYSPMVQGGGAVADNGSLVAYSSGWHGWDLKALAIFGGLLLAAYLGYRASRVKSEPARATTSAAPVPRLPGMGDLFSVLPPGAAGFLGGLLLSKLARAEVSGWLKIIRDWGK